MKIYELKTLAEIIEVVNENNIDGFLVDFGRWLAISIASKSPDVANLIALKDPDTFHWIDEKKTNP